jgi:hypothetical protein
MSFLTAIEATALTMQEPHDLAPMPHGGPGPGCKPKPSLWPVRLRPLIGHGFDSPRAGRSWRL